RRRRCVGGAHTLSDGLGGGGAARGYILNGGGLGGGRRRRRLQAGKRRRVQRVLISQLTEVLEQQDPHIVHGGAVAVQLAPPRTVGPLGHSADRQAAREAAAIARGQDAIAVLHRALPSYIVQPRTAAAVAGQHGACVGSLDHHRNARGDVSQKHHAAVTA